MIARMEETMSLSMIICGDTVPTKDNFKEFAEGNREALVGAPSGMK